MKYLNTDKQTMTDLSIQDRMHGEQVLIPEDSPTLIKEFADIIRQALNFSELKKIPEEYVESKVISAYAIAVERIYCCCPVMTETMDLSASGFWHPFLQDGRSHFLAEVLRIIIVCSTLPFRYANRDSLENGITS